MSTTNKQNTKSNTLKSNISSTYNGAVDIVKGTKKAIKGTGKVYRGLTDWMVKYIVKPVGYPLATFQAGMVANAVVLNKLEDFVYSLSPEKIQAIQDYCTSTDTMEAISKGIYYTLTFAPGVFYSGKLALKVGAKQLEDIRTDKKITWKSHGLAALVGLGAYTLASFATGQDNKIVNYLQEKYDKLTSKDEIEVVKPQEKEVEKVKEKESEYDLNKAKHKEANYQILRDSKIPTVLLENFYLTNLNEVRNFSNDKYVKNHAKKIADGIYAYTQYNDIENIVLSVGHGLNAGAPVPEEYLNYSKHANESGFNADIVDQVEVSLNELDMKDNKKDLNVIKYTYKGNDADRLGKTVDEFNKYSADNSIAVEFHCNTSTYKEGKNKGEINPGPSGFEIHRNKDLKANPKTTALSETIKKYYNN